jgi:hypothetical protein
MPDTNNTLTVANVKSYSSSSLSSTTSSSIPNANNETDNPTTPAKSSDVEGTETRPDVTSPPMHLTALSTADAIDSNDMFASINKSNHNDNANSFHDYKPDSIVTDDYKSNGVVHLPWNMHREKDKSVTSILPNLSGNKKPGEYIMNLVFHNFVMISNRKIEQIVNGDRKVTYFCSFCFWIQCCTHFFYGHYGNMYQMITFQGVQWMERGGGKIHFEHTFAPKF